MVELKLKDLVIEPELESVLRKQTPEEAEYFERQMLEHGGAYDSIKIWNDNGRYVIVDGHHRYWFITAHPELTYRIEVLKEVHNLHEAKMWIYRKQKGQRNLNTFEQTELALKFEPELKEEAKRRMFAGKKIDPTQKSAEGSRKNETRDEMAKIAGVSHDTIDKVKKIVAEGTEEQIEAARSGEKSINKVYREIYPVKPKQKEPQEVAVNQEDSGAQEAQEVQEEQEGEVDTDTNVSFNKSGKLSKDRKEALKQYVIDNYKAKSRWNMAREFGVSADTINAMCGKLIEEGIIPKDYFPPGQDPVVVRKKAQERDEKIETAISRLKDDSTTDQYDIDDFANDILATGNRSVQSLKFLLDSRPEFFESEDSRKVIAEAIDAYYRKIMFLKEEYNL